MFVPAWLPRAFGGVLAGAKPGSFAPAPVSVMDVALGGDTPAAHLYDPTGQTLLSNLTLARGIKWQHILSQRGSGSLEVPLDDPATALITDRSIIKFSWKGAIRFGIRVKSEQCQLAVDGRRWLRLESQPGLLSLLGDAVVYPEYGLNRISKPQRNFGFMSIDGPWKIDTDWITPEGYAWADEVTIRAGYPREFKAANPYWIGAVDPSTPIPGGDIHYFRQDFNVVAAVEVKIMATGDNWMTLYLDGEEIIPPDPGRPLSWRYAYEATVLLAAGDHVIAAKVENARVTSGVDSPLGFICVVYTLTSAGEIDTILLKSDLPHWYAHDGEPEPGWPRAIVVKKLVEEAQDRGCVGPLALTVGYTDTDDSDSEPWTDYGQYAFPVGTLGCDEVASQLGESLVDFDVDAATMTLHAYNRKGSDLSGSVELLLGDDDGSLKSHQTTKATARFTNVLMQARGGAWTEVEDAAGIAAEGRFEVGLSVGSASTDYTSAQIARALLDESAAALVTVDSQSSVLVGAIPYVDYGLGDTITVPNHRNDGTIPARVLGITVDGSAEVAQAYPTLVHDRSGE